MSDKTTYVTESHLHELANNQELLSSYFQDVEKRIPLAKSHEHAKTICNEILQSFNQSCYSDILCDLLAYYCSSLIKDNWSHDNTYTGSLSGNY